MSTSVSESSTSASSCEAAEPPSEASEAAMGSQNYGARVYIA